MTMHVPQGDTYYVKFTTRSFSTGAPAQLAGTPVVDIYEENNLTQITTAETLTVDYDGVTGLNDLAIVCSSGNGFDVGSYYSAVITTGTVGGVSVVGEVVAHFRVMPPEDAGAGIPDVNTTHVNDTAQTANDMSGDIDTILSRVVGTLAAGTHNAQTGDAYAIVNSGTFGNAQLVRSTTPANTLDVSATGEAGIDWANIGSPTTAQNLSATNIDVDQVVASVSGNVDGSVASVTAGVTLAAGAVNDTSVGTLGNSNFSFVDASDRVDVGAVLGTAQTAGDLAALITTVDTIVDNLNLGIIYGTTSGTPTTTSSDTDLTGYADDELIGRVIIFTGGTADGQAARITDYANTSGVVTYETLTTAPAASDAFKIV